MNQYNKINVIVGWIVFLIASFTYLSTIEPTASLWDCGEFIANVYKLEVGHPPGAPLFMIIGRVASFFATDASTAALAINALSAIASAFTILFLFWTITHLAKKIVVKEGESISTSQIISIIGSGLVGALAYCFSDTFWFSAVEAEVYALSSLFTAVVFWAILKWENVANEPHSNKWIILIAYLMGLSIGVHLLNLLAIPAIAFVFYFKKFKVTRNGVIYTSLISMALVGAIMYIIIPFTVRIASWFELFFVNSMGMPFNSGVTIYALLAIGLIVYGIYYTQKHGHVILNTIILGVTVILIGYSSFAMIVIRSNANPPMDENNPDNVFALLSYLNREQYGDRPLMFGQYFSAPVVDYKKTSNVYWQDKKAGKYIVSNQKTKYIYPSNCTTIFPRMYSDDKNHVGVYKQYMSGGKTVYVENREGQKVPVIIPTFGENLRFFFQYQLGHMYFRYFMWNFAGRQNDDQGSTANISSGNWISGIDWIDSKRIGKLDKLPDHMKNHPTRNTYFMLPFLLGLLGLFFQLNTKKGDFVVTSLLFFFTGIAIVIYLNQTPIQPRERDYAYAGSFYAFAIWIGLGVLACISAFGKLKKNAGVPSVVTVILLLLVPGIMVSENWDDHDRSGRYSTKAIARNYLESCAPNAIIFTNGDNDTFPLWYAQEVEGIRTDVRICCLPLAATEWYLDQMKHKAYESDPLPISMTKDQFRPGKRELTIFRDSKDGKYYDLKQIIRFIKREDTQAKNMCEVPTNKFKLRVDSAAIVKSGMVPASMVDSIPKEIKWTFGRKQIYKNTLAVLDMLATNDWKRPIYFTTLNHESTLGLDDYFKLDGFAYRLTPIKTKGERYFSQGFIDTDDLYEKYMNKFTWGRVDKDDVHVCHHVHRTFSVLRVRNKFSRLAEALLAEGKTEKAIKVLDRCMEILPTDKFPFTMFYFKLIQNYYQAGEIEKGNLYLTKYFNYFAENAEYYMSVGDKFFPALSEEMYRALAFMQNSVALAKENNQDNLTKDFEKRFRAYVDQYSLLTKRMRGNEGRRTLK